ncbi:MAG: 4-hydroxy-tetrahydrodipicolinate synthase [Bacteroidaceae bacterium]|nr:4-hydroxy-tetrahydrodipicolinate synthase [Bacteroidaceae bacterium]
MAQNKFRGLGIALVTPFQADGSIDFDALDRLIEYQIQGGADFLCIMGTTAETPTLSREEKRLLKEHFVERVAGRVPLLMGCGGNNTAAILEELQTENWKGIDGILSVCPYYNKPTQEGLYQHFAAIAKASPVPVVLYNVPGRTGVNMTAETTLRLAREFENIVAIKEASGNITQMDDIIKNKPKHFDVISGDDGITFPLITLGAVGVISVIGNALPAEFSRMVRLALKGEYNTSLSIHHKFTELFKLLFVDGNPAGVKAMLSEMGLIQNVLRLPLIPTRLTTMEKISQIVRELGY